MIGDDKSNQKMDTAKRFVNIVLFIDLAAQDLVFALHGITNGDQCRGG